MTRYSYDISLDESSDSFTKLIKVGTRTLQFDFQWAIVSEEQYSLITRYLTTKATSDPIMDSSGSLNREYDWYTYYYSLKSVDLDEWLDKQTSLPVSLRNKTRDVQLYLLNIYITEAISLEPAARLYNDIMKWQFTMTCDNLTTTVGYVQPGGWYLNQDSSLSFCFVSDLATIGEDDITKVSIVFEVYDEQ